MEKKQKTGDYKVEIVNEHWSNFFQGTLAECEKYLKENKFDAYDLMIMEVSRRRKPEQD